MSLEQIILLSIIQGITEFLPVSSSGHLILVSEFTRFPDQGLALDVALHVGSLFAVMIYFARDVLFMLKGLPSLLARPNPPGAKLVWHCVVATLPIVVAGFLLTRGNMDFLRNTEVMGWSIMGFGILLYISDKTGLTVKKVEHMTTRSALFIGIAQVLALIPGTSRSGITMTAARFSGFERTEAARFSMLLSIPTIIAAGTLVTLELIEAGQGALNIWFFYAVALAFVSAILAIYLMMRWLKKSTFTPFVVYRIIMGLVLLGNVYGFIKIPELF